MVTVREEGFGAIVSDSSNGIIIQTNIDALDVILKYYTNRSSVSLDEWEFLYSDVFHNTFKETNEMTFFPLRNKEQSQTILCAPESLIVRLTNRCNMNCEGCYEKRSEGIDEDMPFSMLTDIISKAASSGVCRMQFGGGEPLLYPNLLEAVDLSSQKGLFTSVGTNGVLLTDKMIENLYSCGIGHIQMTLTNPQKTEETINTQVLYTSETIRKKGIKFGYNIILMRQNLDSILSIIEMAQKTNPNNINILQAKPASHNLEWYKNAYVKTSSEQVKELVKLICSKFKNVKLDCSLSALCEEEYGMGCLGATRSMVVLPDGKILPCPFMASKGTSDFYYSYSGMREIWEKSKELNEFRTKLETYDETKDKPLYFIKRCPFLEEKT